MNVKHTYASRKRQILKSIPPPATPATDRPSKRPLSDDNETATRPGKRHKPCAIKGAKSKEVKPTKSAQKKLTQLHFTIDQSILRTCSLCDLSYTKGAPADEALHRSHCVRVRQGMEWGREEEKDRIRNGVVEVEADVILKKGKKKGRIISFSADIGGKLGAKLGTLLQTINLSLSAPALPQSNLQSSKAYLFLIPHDTQTHRERIIGCVIAQHIKTAMAIEPSDTNSVSGTTTTTNSQRPVIIDTSTNLCCSPSPLPTPMGISRLFVSSSHRRLGIARALLDAAATSFIYGCPLDPRKGQVAFSQPTGMGQSVMKSWGCSRVYEE